MNKPFSISEIGEKLRQAGRLQGRPLCVYGSKTKPNDATLSTSINRCVAMAIATVAFRDDTPAIYVAAEMPKACCPGGLAHLGFTGFNPDIKYSVSTGSKEYRNSSDGKPN